MENRYTRSVYSFSLAVVVMFVVSLLSDGLHKDKFDGIGAAGWAYPLRLAGTGAAAALAILEAVLVRFCTRRDALPHQPVADEALITVYTLSGLCWALAFAVTNRELLQPSNGAGVTAFMSCGALLGGWVPWPLMGIGNALIAVVYIVIAGILK